VAGHLDALCAVGLAAQLWQATTIHVGTRDEMSAYLRSALAAQSAGTALPFVIIEKQSGTIVGSTRYHSFSTADRHVEIGHTWVALRWQRTFVNTEAKYLLLRHAFETLRCIRVQFRADAENHASRRALVRIGAREEGVMRRCRISQHRGIRDLAFYSIIDEEWPRIRLNLEAKLSR
jgi:RimJ/RimL family protein N-acetyltransferase